MAPASPRTTRSHAGILGTHMPASLARELTRHTAHWHATWTTHARSTVHSRWHTREPWTWSTPHIVWMAHRIAPLRPTREWSPRYVLATPIWAHPHLTHLCLIVAHGCLVSLLCHVHSRVWVWGWSSLSTEHSPMRVYWHPHIDAWTTGTDGHITQVLRTHAGTHHLRPARTHSLHHLHPTQVAHVLGAHALHGHPALHLHLASMVAHATELAHTHCLALAIALLHRMSLHAHGSPHAHPVVHAHHPTHGRIHHVWVHHAIHLKNLG